jgi:hypothetical protein
MDVLKTTLALAEGARVVLTPRRAFNATLACAGPASVVLSTLVVLNPTLAR